VIGALVAASASPVLAQAGTRDVQGVVRDALTSRPLVGVSIALESGSTRQSIRSDETGAFLFHGVATGGYRISARRIGYGVWSQQLVIDERTPSLAIALTPIATLDTVRVRPELGVYGVVGAAKDLRPLAGAKIQILGSDRTATSDSTGRFSAGLRRPGFYVTRATLDGYEPQAITVTVRRDSSAELAFLLDSATHGPLAKVESAWNDFGDRLRLRGPRSAVVPRSDLLKNGDMGLVAALERSSALADKTLRLGSEVCVFIDGQPAPATPLWSIDASMVQTVEVYTGSGVATPSDNTGTLRRMPLSQCTATGLPSTSGETIKYVVVWMAK
jgi:hypothetical protein